MFVSQFKDILDYVSILNEVDTENVPPAYLSSANKSVSAKMRSKSQYQRRNSLPTFRNQKMITS